MTFRDRRLPWYAFWQRWRQHRMSVQTQKDILRRADLKFDTERQEILARLRFLGKDKEE